MRALARLSKVFGKNARNWQRNLSYDFQRKALDKPALPTDVVREMKEWYVPFVATFRGEVYVEAETQEEAEALVEKGKFDLGPGTEMTDWECTGDAKEIK